MSRDPAIDMIENVDLLISVMICFPEVGKIRYYGESDLLKISFLLYAVDSEAEFEASLAKVEKGLERYRRITQTQPNIFSVNYKEINGFLVVDVCRDFSTLTHGELAVTIDLFRDVFGDRIFIEEMNDLAEDDFHWYVRDEKRLPRRHGSEKRFGSDILVYRDAGKVLVFSNEQYMDTERSL